MAETLKTADGQLANTKSTLYTVPASTSAVIKIISLVNVSGSTVTVNLYVKPGGTSRQIVRKNYSLAPNDGLLIDSVSIILEAGDLLEGDASAATAVDYYIGLVEFS